MELIATPVFLSSIRDLANCVSPDGKPLCKAVVDIERKIMAIGAPMQIGRAHV